MSLGFGFTKVDSQSTSTDESLDARSGEPGYIRTADGVSLFYRDWGRGEPVVFVASWSLPSDMWNYQMLALSERGCRCVGFDPRGQGRSSDPGGGFDYDRLRVTSPRFLRRLICTASPWSGTRWAPR